MQVRKSIFLLLFMVSAAAMFAQSKPASPYAVNLQKEVPLAIGGLGLSVSSYILEHNIEPRTPEDISGVNLQNLFRLDRDGIDNFSSSADVASDWMLRSSLVLPLTLMADRDIRNDAGKIAVLLSESTLLTYGFTNLTKVIVKRDRPFIHNPDVPVEMKLAPNGQLSFFSGHTSMTASLSFFTAKVWTDYHPDSRLKPLVWTAAAALPAVTGYMRYKAGKHYLTDVATGYAVGALVGYFIPHLHKIDRKEKRKFRLSTSSIDNIPVFNMKYRF